MRRIAAIMAAAILLAAPLFAGAQTPAAPHQAAPERTVKAASSSFALREYSRLSADEKHTKTWRKLTDLVEYYNSAYDKKGKPKSHEEWLRHQHAAKFIEDSFLPLNTKSGKREMNKQKMATLRMFLDKLAEVNPDETLEGGILFFVRQEYARR